MLAVHEAMRTILAQAWGNQPSDCLRAAVNVLAAGGGVAGVWHGATSQAAA